MQPFVSIVIPCYNETKRLVTFFDPWIKRVDATGLDYECLLVDDGSRDSTYIALQERAAINPRLKPLTHLPNRGRGYSVRQGMMAANGRYIFETDVDGSYDVPEMVRFINFLESHPEYDMVIASREQNDAKALINQPPLRIVAGKIFHALFFLFFGGEFTDVMAGCKIYRRDAAKVIFSHQYDNEFLGAAETVYAANKLGFKIKELPVTWTDDPEGSKVNAWRAARRTLIGMIQMKWRGLRGMYRRV